LVATHLLVADDPETMSSFRYGLVSLLVDPDGLDDPKGPVLIDKLCFLTKLKISHRNSKTKSKEGPDDILSFSKVNKLPGFKGSFPSSFQSNYKL
jgi:hypothetical protein